VPTLAGPLDRRGGVWRPPSANPPSFNGRGLGLLLQDASAQTVLCGVFAARLLPGARRALPSFLPALLGRPPRMLPFAPSVRTCADAPLSLVLSSAAVDARARAAATHQIERRRTSLAGAAAAPPAARPRLGHGCLTAGGVKSYPPECVRCSRMRPSLVVGCSGPSVKAKPLLKFSAPARLRKRPNVIRFGRSCPD